MPSQTLSSPNTRYLFTLTLPLSTPSALQQLLKTSRPPGIVTARSSDGDTIEFALLPVSAIEAVAEYLYPEPPNFKLVQIAAKNLSEHSVAPSLGLDATLPQHRRHEGQEIRPKQHEYPVLYFFYGTLADPRILKSKLHLDVEPVFTPATIRGGAVMMWGQYRALIDGKHESRVQGQAYEVQTKEEEELLRFYETEMYEVARCEIVLENDKTVHGLTFRFCGGIEKLE